MITTAPTANPAGISICFGRRRNGEMGDEETHSWRSDLYSSVDPQERSYRAKKTVREMSASMLDGM